LRVGFGIDTHPLVSKEKMVLGGVEIDSKLGIKGHSDGDALIHAIVDGLLGAMGEGDIGEHFPDSDVRWKGARSSQFLSYCVPLLKRHGLKINNIDATIVLEQPKIGAYKEEMKKNIALLLGLDPRQVNVKATTSEGMGFVGRNEGITVYAVVLLE